MNQNELYTLKEGQTVELKEARDSLPRNVWETVSAFSNTIGGTIYLGIKEGKENEKNSIVGVKNPRQRIKDILSAARSPEKLSFASFGEDDFSVLSVDGLSVICWVVHEAPKYQKPVYINGAKERCFVRVGDGDHLASEGEMASMMIDRRQESYDLSPNALNLDFSAVNLPTLAAFRKELNRARPNNLYKGDSDETFLYRIGCLRDNGRGKLVLSNAALMMFSTYPLIQMAFPSFYLDYRKAPSVSDKWEDRIAADSLDWSGNLFDFLLMVEERLRPSLPAPYHVEGMSDVGPTLGQDLLREALVNAMSNYSPLLPGGILVLKTDNSIFVRNAGRIKVGLSQALLGGVSDPRNSGIMTLFRLLGFSDHAGTGIPRIFSLCKACHLPDPIFQEQASPDMTSLTITLTQISHPDTPEEEKVLSFLKQKGTEGAHLKEIASALSIGSTKASKLISEMVQKGTVKTNGGKTKGKKFFAGNVSFR